MTVTLSVKTEKTEAGICAYIESMPGIIVNGETIQEIKENITDHVKERHQYNHIDFKYTFIETD